jgi:hypothetical protein
VASSTSSRATEVLLYSAAQLLLYLREGERRDTS